ncbi:hypothetical protein PHMEG_00014903 [Phytophthora megakarya]|uniref:Uncharacterized protein n=1 Tax=Phytophthora megakarya TaxID=4795 RepID=A0A225W558_9STRA|nr:hypothetical protein PHMEG_00014903 [Phytophthora megakarya]
MLQIKHAAKEKKHVPLDVLIIDQISMMTKYEGMKLDKLLHRNMQVENVPFGGNHIVLVEVTRNVRPYLVNLVNKTMPSTVKVE